MLLSTLRISDQTWWGKALRLPFQLVPADLEMPVWIGPLRGRRWIVGSAVHGCWLGLYEWEKANLIKRAIAPGMVFFDIGAMAGYFTLLAAPLVGPHGRVYAFEPLPRNLTYLRRHVAMHALDNVTIVEAAVSNSQGVAAFDLGAHPVSGRLAAGGSLQVRTVGLDEEIAVGRLPVPHAIKIDVEGAELQLLQGAAKTLQSARPQLFLDLHGFLGPSFAHLDQDCQSLLVRLGYRFRRLGEHDIYAWCE